MSKKAMTGNEAAAYAMKQINPDVCAAYPITPATEVMHAFSKYVADGDVKTELITVESEHSAISATLAASVFGCRAMTATSANGLALMHEILHVVAGYRKPVVMAIANRSIGGPINIHCDHSTIMAQRDTGWMHFFCENAQEAYDFMIMAVKIAESHKVLLPATVNYDGFIVSHTTEGIDTMGDKEVQEFLGEHKPVYPLSDLKNPVSYGQLVLTDYFSEIKRTQAQGMENAPDIITDVFEEFNEKFGRRYSFIEEYNLEDAEYVIVALGSSAGTTKAAVDSLRRNNVKAGMLKVRVFRPFPADDIAKALSKKTIKAIGVMDRTPPWGPTGPLDSEVKAAVHGKDVPIINFIYGLGGRDTTKEDLLTAFNVLHNSLKKKTKEVLFLNTRGDEILKEKDKEFFPEEDSPAIEIRVHARGGQGAKTMAILVTGEAIENGLYSQGFPKFGPERRGAPIEAFIRISKDEIKVRSDINYPDIVIVSDNTLIETVNVVEGLTDKGVIIINTTDAKGLREKLKLSKNVKLFVCDANKISQEELGMRMPNTVLIGAMFKILGEFGMEKDLDKASKYFMAHFKFKQEVKEANIRALKRGYEEVKLA